MISLVKTQRNRKLTESPSTIKRKRNAPQVSLKYHYTNNYTQKFIEKSGLAADNSNSSTTLNKKSSTFNRKKKFGLSFGGSNNCESSSVPKYNEELKLNHNSERNSKNLEHSHSCVRPPSNKSSIFTSLSTKEKALTALATSDVLTLKEKIIMFCSVKQALTEKDEKRIKKRIINSASTKIKRQIEKIKKELIFSPTKIAMNCINFIKVQDETDLVKTLVDQNVIKEMPDVYQMLGEQMKVIYLMLNMYKSKPSDDAKELVCYLYETIMPKLNINSISKFAYNFLEILFTNILYRKITCGPNEVEMIREIVDNNLNIFNSSFYLGLSRVPAFISFSLKELYEFMILYQARVGTISNFEQLDKRIQNGILSK